ncbi:MAG: hypothetical protein M1840_006330 [Geoglossum simile]|nr:MAG: hypothetical protein M1840_006330 [Geoglossum simile]
MDTMIWNKVAPSFVGEVPDRDFAEKLLNDSLKGKIPHVPRQPRGCTDIQKGNVFISEENASGVKEWDDGFVWCEVKSSGGFKVYVTDGIDGIDGGLCRKITTFKVNGLIHLVAYY